jgi:hypothetical protein
MPTYTNLSILQGWLEVESVQVLTMERMPVAVVNGWVYTTDHDGLETFFGERHPVMISGRPADAILDITRKLNDKYPHLSGISLVHLPGALAEQSQILVSQGRPYVIAQGKLLSHNGQSRVDLKHISFLGLPWGALDALSEMEPVMNRDVRALVSALTPLEKSQISQAIGAALQALLALRSPCRETAREQA